MIGAVDPVTQRYSEALFALAQEKGALDAVSKDVERLAAALSDPALDAYVADARVPSAKKRARVTALVPDPHHLTANFLGLVFDKHREHVLRGLGPAFRKLLLASRGAVEGVAESARPLDRGELESLSKAISRDLAKDVRLQNRIVPDLIGGVRVLVDNRLLDQSVVGRLAGLRRRLATSRITSRPA